MPDIFQPNYVELINSRERLEQSQQANSPRNGGVSLPNKTSNPTTHVVDATQTASTSYVTPQVATAETSALGAQSSESGMPEDGHTESASINSVGDVGLDGQPTADWNTWDDFGMNFDIDGEAEISARLDHAMNGNADLFGEEEDLLASLQPLAEWNQQN